MESYTTTSKHSTNTSTACDTPSIKADITDTPEYTLSLCLNFQNFFWFWMACDTQASKQIQQNNRQLDITSRTYIYTTTRQQNTLISTTSGETFNTIYNTNQKNKNNQVLHLGPIYNLRRTPHIVRRVLSTRLLWLLFQVCKMVI